MTPEAFAVRTDGLMSKPRLMSAQTLTDTRTSLGVGKDRASVAILSATKFHVEYPWATEKEKYKDWANHVEVANGQMFSRKRTGGWLDKGPIATRPPLAGSVLATWPLLGPARVLGSVGTNHKPLAALVREAKAAKLKVFVEKTVSSGFALERLRILRGGKKPLDIQIVVDPNRWVPLSMKTITIDAYGKPLNSLWAAKWDMSPNQKLRPEFFQFIQ